jgi:CheY-like chemotaxis protein
VPRVLLVDDDLAQISAVKRVLARAGHQSLLATNAVDAVSAAARTSPAVVVVSATCDGGQALLRLGEDEAARALPMVVLGESPASPAGAAQLGRPIDPALLAEALAAALRAGGDPAKPSPPAAASPPAPAPKRTPAGRAAPAGARPAPASRKAAADALRARAEELRRGAVTSTEPAPTAAPAPPRPRPPLELDFDLDEKGTEEPGTVQDTTDAALAELEAPASAPTPTLDPSLDPGLEAILRRAEDAERAYAAQKKARAAAARASRPSPPDASSSAEDGRSEEEARQAAKAEARRAADEARQAAEAEARHAEEEARRATEAEARRKAQAEARRAAEAARRAAEAEARRAEETRRAEEEETRAQEAHEREEQLRAAIESARSEMEALRRRGEDEARRRAEAEAEVARLAREAARRTREAAGAPPPLEVPVYRPPAEDPTPDPVQQSARRRVAALRGRTPDGGEEGAPDLAGDAAPLAAVRTPPPELRAGTLADLPLPRLLALAFRAEASGRIDFEGDAVRSLWLADGRVTGAASSAPGERVDEVALRLGLLTREQHRLLATAAAPLATRRAAVMMVERGFVKPAELAALVRRRTEEVVFGIFGDAGARFRWSAGEVPPDESTALERTTLQLAVEGVRRRWLAPEVDAVLGGDATLLSRIAAGPGAADLALSPDERRVLALADGLRTLDEIAAASPLDPLSTRQVLAALVLVGSLAVRTFQGGRPAAQAAAAIDLARVRDKLDQVRRADYFTILGVGRLCTPHEIREAYERLRAEFDPRRYQGLREDGLPGRLDEIQRVVADARDVLADDRLRAEYLRGLGE